MTSARSSFERVRPSADAAASGDETASIIASCAYANGKRVADIPIDDAGEWARKEGHVVWIGLLEPDGELLHRVQKQFGLHSLAIEDAEHAHQRPKLEQYGDAIFVVARTAQLIDGRVAFGETHVFLGKGYIVSVRHGASTSYTAVRQHWETAPYALAKGEDFVLYAILDFIVDNYMPVLEAIHDEVESIEDRVLAKPMTSGDIERLYMLRRDLLRLRNAIGPLVDVCGRLSNTDLPQIQTAMQPLFRDVTDHVRTVQEKIDGLREVLAFAFEASSARRPKPGNGYFEAASLLGGHFGRADCNRRHLRHEFQTYAGTRLPERLLLGARRDPSRMPDLVLAVPQERLALEHQPS